MVDACLPSGVMADRLCYYHEGHSKLRKSCLLHGHVSLSCPYHILRQVGVFNLKFMNVSDQDIMYFFHKEITQLHLQ